MACQYFCGFETGLKPSLYVNTGSAATITIDSTVKNGGAYSLKLASTSSEWTLTGPSYTAGTNTDDMLCQVLFRTDTAPVTSAETFLTLAMGSGTFIDVVINTNGSFQAYRSTTAGAKTTSLGTSASSSLISTNTWYALWVRVKPATGSTGICELWLNNVQILNVTAAVTSNGLSTTRTLTIGRPVFANGNVWLDDIVLADSTSGFCSGGTVPAPVKVETALVPTSDSTVAWTPSAGGGNFAQVDEIPMAATDYVSTTVSGTRDLYGVTDRPGGNTSAIQAVQATALAECADPGVANLKVGIKVSASEVQSAASPLTSTASHVSKIAEVDPNTGIAWTSSGVNAALLTIEAA